MPPLSGKRSLALLRRSDLQAKMKNSVCEKFQLWIIRAKSQKIQKNNLSVQKQHQEQLAMGLSSSVNVPTIEKWRRNLYSNEF